MRRNDWERARLVALNEMHKSKRHPHSNSMLQDLLKELDQCRIVEKQKHQRSKATDKTDCSKIARTGFIKPGSTEWLERRDWRWRTWIINKLKDNLLEICPNITAAQAKVHIQRLLLKLLEVRKVVTKQLMTSIHGLRARYYDAEKKLQELRDLSEEEKAAVLSDTYGGLHYHVHSQAVLTSLAEELDRKWIPLDELKKMMKEAHPDRNSDDDEIEVQNDSEVLQKLEAEGGKKDEVPSEANVVVVNIDREDADNMQKKTLEDVDPADAVDSNIEVTVENMDQEDHDSRVEKMMHDVDVRSREQQRACIGGDEEAVILAAPRSG